MRKKYIAAVTLIFLVGVLFSVQAFPQIKKKQLIKIQKVPAVKSQALLFVQGKLRVISHRSEIKVRIVLKNNDKNGEPEKSASITVNGANIPETSEAGKYEGVAKVNSRGGSGYPVDIKIVTQDKREITSSGKFDALLRLDISNIFPNQKDKIDVGTPVTISWKFNPSSRQPVDLTISDANTKGIIFQKKGLSGIDKLVIPVGTIPKHKKVKFSIKVPTIKFPINQQVHSNSYIKLQLEVSRKLNTFG